MNKDKKEFEKFTKNGKDRNPNVKKNSTKRRYAKSRSGRQKESDYTTGSSCGMNDPAWYKHRPELFNTAGNLNFTYPAGYRIQMNNPILQQTPNKGMFTVPGALAIAVAPTFGYSKDGSSPLNIASFKEYAFIRSKNSGSRNYDAPDLTLYMLSVTEIVSYINWLQRIYRMVRTYTFENEYIPKGVLQLENIDYDSIANNLAAFEYNLNLRIDKARQLLIPSHMDLIKRRAFMFQDLFIEGTSVKDQLYFFTPDGFYYFELDTDGAGMLTYKSRSDLQSGVWDIHHLFTHLDNMISAISEQEDFLIMAGDLYKAYGDGGILSWNNFSGDGFVALSPVFNIEVLEQMANGTSLGIRQTTRTSIDGRYEASLTQSANKSYLITDSKIHLIADDTGTGASRFLQNADIAAMQTLLEDRILTTSTGKTDQDLVFENTRLMTIPRTYEADEYGTWPRNAYVKDIISGSEVITYFSIIRFHVKADMTRNWVIYNYGYGTNITIGYGSNPVNAAQSEQLGDEIASDLKALNSLSFFKFHPQVHIIMTRGGTTLPAYQVADGLFQTDVDNFTIINKDILTRLHETAFISMLDI